MTTSTLRSPKNIFALAFLALLVYINFGSDPRRESFAPDEAMFALNINEDGGGLRGSQIPLLDLSGRRALSQEEIKEVEKLTGWVEEKSVEFTEEQRHRVSFDIICAYFYYYYVSFLDLFINTHRLRFSLYFIFNTVS